MMKEVDLKKFKEKLKSIDKLPYKTPVIVSKVSINIDKTGEFDRKVNALKFDERYFYFYPTGGLLCNHGDNLYNEKELEIIGDTYWGRDNILEFSEYLSKEIFKGKIYDNIELFVKIIIHTILGTDFCDDCVDWTQFVVKDIFEEQDIEYCTII